MKAFSISYTVSNPQLERFILHSHDNYEIIFFINGDVDYIVEGAVYPLKPHDMILVRPHEMHRAFHKSNQSYMRLVMNIENEFFSAADCLCYQDVFQKRSVGTKNYISADSVHESGISELFTRLKKYTGDFTDFSVPVTNGIILELLHLLNNSDIYDAPHSNRVQEVIAFINQNFQSNITLSSVSDEFYISKSHLSRLFRKSTGYTVSEYVNHKRISSVRERCASGMTLGDACMKSGFNDYTAFYRAFRKENGASPRRWIQENNIKSTL